MNTVSKNFDFRENGYTCMYNSAGNTNFWARLNVNSFADVGLLMTNDGALELWHQEEIMFAHLEEGRNNYKKWLHTYVMRANRVLVSASTRKHSIIEHAHTSSLTSLKN